MREAVFALAFGLIALGATTAIAGQPTTTYHRTGAQDKADDGSFLARSTKGGFVVKLPLPFNDVTMNMSGKSGDIVVHAIGTRSADNMEFSAMATERNEKMKNSDMRESLNDLGKPYGIVPEIAVDHRNGVKVYSTHFATAPQSAYVLVAKTDDRYFTVTCEYPIKKAAAAKPYCEKFLKSFAIE